MDTGASVGVGLGLAALVYGIYDACLPPIVDQRNAVPGEPESTQAEKTARWSSAALVAVVSAITMDPTVFILGASMVIIESWMYRHANHAVEPAGSPTSQPSSRQLASIEAQAGPAYAQAGI